MANDSRSQINARVAPFFDYLFPGLRASGPDDNDLSRLAATMIEPPEDPQAGPDPLYTGSRWTRSDNPDIAAGFTYLGQFIDHDLTFDPSSPRFRTSGLASSLDSRTPAFNLDSLYAGGPERTPVIYDGDGVRLRTGQGEDGREDLPRDDQERAVIPDARNDENLIVAQIHLAFIKYHNRVVGESDGPRERRFEQASETVRRHYQWVVLHEFLPRFVGYRLLRDVLDDGEYRLASWAAPSRYSLTRGPRFFHPGEHPFLPLEFSMAAFRVGHSMVRPRYVLNTATESGIPIFDTDSDDAISASDLRGSRRLPKDRRIEWSRFFPFRLPDPQLQVARTFDTKLAYALGSLPPSVARGGSRSLAERNLQRGKERWLPTGQAVARAIGVPREEIPSLDNPVYRFRVGAWYSSRGRQDPSLPRVMPAVKEYLEHVFGEDTPLWYYVLKEAELLRGGRSLGPVGGRIVAEVFAGLLRADATSVLNTAPVWRPKRGRFGCRRDGVFTMVDLLKYADPDRP
jgi:hypothetical protein